ncbi:hypothetical protein KCP75_01610 [Salmonella enterica subsp. enterica]|nr:hypothetical protein KCP75_01610 [Salmonella enterica subsp. enterica]
MTGCDWRVLRIIWRNEQMRKVMTILMMKMPTGKAPRGMVPRPQTTVDRKNWWSTI